MINLKEARAQLFADLGYKPLNKIWAKVEILLGLLAVGGSLLALISFVVHTTVPTKDFTWPALCLVLFVLGGYLTLAGHRSHLYQSENDRTAYLLEQILQLKEICKSRNGPLQ